LLALVDVHVLWVLAGCDVQSEEEVDRSSLVVISIFVVIVIVVALFTFVVVIVIIIVMASGW
jgi:hypothetical protein